MSSHPGVEASVTWLSQRHGNGGKSEKSGAVIEIEGRKEIGDVEVEGVEEGSLFEGGEVAVIASGIEGGIEVHHQGVGHRHEGGNAPLLRAHLAEVPLLVRTEIGIEGVSENVPHLVEGMNMNHGEHQDLRQDLLGLMRPLQPSNICNHHRSSSSNISTNSNNNSPHRTMVPLHLHNHRSMGRRRLIGEAMDLHQQSRMVVHRRRDSELLLELEVIPRDRSNMGNIILRDEKSAIKVCKEIKCNVYGNGPYEG